jgi:hypothetical protein
MSHRLAPQAEADLDDIWFYVATESGRIEIRTASSSRNALDPPFDYLYQY